ncbi:UNVERIFIED_ORG: cytolysin-activating lysine-acyltransferase [Ensifer adhaerens]|nr:cytolysin-activating lysine-acyltransferase [Ensifer adhaerens]
MVDSADVSKQSNSFNLFEVLGMMAVVAMDSDYRNWSLAEIEAYLVPALDAGQYKVYINDEGRPTAFVTWALVDDECHGALVKHGSNPPANRWCSGRNLWFMDIVAPYGNALHVIRDLQRNYFPDMHAHSIKRNEDGSVKRIKVWRNALVDRDAG